MAGIAIRNATIIDATGAAAQENSTIVTGDNGEIVAIGPDASVEIPQGVETIDGTGTYVIPGLMDANVHLVASRTPDSLLDFEGRYHELALEAAELTLKYGTTTVFDTWGPAGPLTTARDAINAGEAQGSRVYCAGNIIGLGGPLTMDFTDTGVLLQRDTVARINEVWERGTGPDLAELTREQIGERVEQYIEETGVDFIKWAVTDHNSNVPATYHVFGDDQQRALVEAARKHGKTVQAHTTSVESLRLEVELDAEVLQHGDITAAQPIPDSLIQEIVDKGLPTAALVVTERHLDWVRSGKVPTGKFGVIREIAAVNQRNLIKAGARILLTTDGFAYGPRVTDHPGFRAGTLSPDVPDLPVQLGYSHFNWIKGAHEKGLSPMEVLRSSTAYIADAYRVSDTIGTLEAGKQADLLVLNSDPLASPDAYRDIRHVVKGGSVVDRDKLATNMQLGSDLIVEHGL